MFRNLLYIDFGGVMMKHLQKKTAIVLIVLFVISLFQFLNLKEVVAENKTYTSMVDVVFLVDASKSMKTSDAQGLTAEAMKMFIDMCHIKGDKGGMVAYSGDIVKEAKLNYLNSEADKSTLKNTLSNLELGNWTDIGLGLKRAVSILKEGHDENNKPIIILLSDGKNDPKRDKIASQDDLAAGLNEAKVQNFPVYTIGLNADGTVDKNQLESISRETNGKNFITNNANELPQILREVFADNSRLKISQQNTLIGNGEFQNAIINIPDSNIIEANITILSLNPVELKLNDNKGNEVKFPADKVLYTKSNKYSMIKLVSPEKGNWVVKIKGSKEDKIDISLISNYDFKTVIGLKPESNVFKGDKVEVSAYIESNGQKLDDNEFNSTLKSTLYIKNLANGETKALPMTNSNNEFVAEVTIPDKNSYELIAKIEGEGFTKESIAKFIGGGNRAPITTKKDITIILWNKNIKKIDLSKYFSDQDSDKLNFEVSSTSLDTVNFKVNGTNLEMQGRKWGSDTVTVTADDGKGGKVSSEIKISVWFLLYIIPAVLVLLIILIILIILRKKRIEDRNIAPVGQMMLQIKDEETGNISSPQYKDLSSFKGTFSIYDLLDLNPDYEETSKILLKAEKGENLTITNNSQYSIESNGKQVDASKGISLRNEEKIEIIITNTKQIISMKYYSWNSSIFVESLFT